MYNPADHIPLSKPLGASGFPLDGKFMFYTNGEGGVYKYRPFQNVAEVLSYFPLGSDFRKGSFQILVNSGGTLSSDGGSITGGTNSIYWWKDGVTNADLVSYNLSLKLAPLRNLFNKDTVVTGTLNTSGQVSGTDPLTKTSALIAVEGNKDYVVSGFSLDTGTEIHRLAWYDAAGTFITPTINLVVAGDKITRLKSPSLARFARINVKRATDPAGNFDLLQFQRDYRIQYIGSFEPYTLQVVEIDGKTVRNSNIDIYSKEEVDSLVPTITDQPVFNSKNMANPANFIAGQYYNVGDGYTVQPDSRYWTSGFIPVQEGIVYSGTAMRFVYFYKADGSNVLPNINGLTTAFTVPVGSDITQIRFAGYTADFSMFQFERSDAPTSYTPYAGFKEFIGKINGKPLVAGALGAGATLDGEQIATIEDVNNAKNSLFANLVTVLKDNYSFYIRGYFNETYDIVQQVEFEPINNKSFEFIRTRLITKDQPDTISGYATGVILQTNADDTAPIRTANEGHIGEGHGFQQPLAVATHDKDSSDILSLWQDSGATGNEFYLVEVNGNNLQFYSKPKLVAGHMTTEKDFSSQTAVLTHVSGGTHTGNITLTSYTIVQKYPVTQDNVNRLYVDGKEVETDGVYRGYEAKFLSEYNIVDCTALVLQNPFKWNDGPPFGRFSIAYIYQPNGALVTHHEINFLRDKPIQYWYVNQAAPISSAAYPRRFGYLPKTTEIGGYNYNDVVETTTALPEALFSPTYYIDANLPPDRHIQFHADSGGVKKIGFAMGFNTEYGVAKNSLRKDLVNTWALSPKSYPRVIYNYDGLNQVIAAIGYRIWFDAEVGEATCVYGYNLDGVNYLFIDYKTTVVKELVPVNPLFTNKDIEIVEQYGDITLHTNEKVPARGLLISATVGSLLLKIK